MSFTFPSASFAVCILHMSMFCGCNARACSHWILLDKFTSYVTTSVGSGRARGRRVQWISFFRPSFFFSIFLG